MVEQDVQRVVTTRAARHDDAAAAILGRLSGRSVRCYLCGEWFRTAARAETASCTHCNRQVQVQDMTVRDSAWCSAVTCCGRITVQRRGIVRARIIVACHGVKILGRAEGALYCGGPVFIGKEAIFKGSINAPSLEIESGALVDGGPFYVPDQPIGRVEFPRGGAGRVLGSMPLATSA